MEDLTELQVRESNLSYCKLRSLVNSGKVSFQMKYPSESFYVAGRPKRTYIEPVLKIIEGEVERPKIILISAVGATGKTTLAQMLSFETQLPLLDMAKHKSVGDRTFTGLLTDGYDLDDLSNIIRSVKDGSFGVIIDGIDEGRSKTNESAFHAFLDDICRQCGKLSNVSFIILGRTQVLEDCWLYFDDKGISTNLLSIAPFSLEQAKKYIDAFTPGVVGVYSEQYKAARDFILDHLDKAFSAKYSEEGDDFLSFIGYPPVLEAIIALFDEGKNYHKLIEQLQNREVKNIEVSLLRKIGLYILHREREEKVIHNIVDPLIADLPEETQKEIRSSIYSVEEQCVRIVASLMNEKPNVPALMDKNLYEKYENALETFNDHPFVLGKKRFSNAIFESLALAKLIKCDKPHYSETVQRYIGSHKHNYHLIYMLEGMVSEGTVPIKYLGAIIEAAQEFRSTMASVDITIEAQNCNEILKLEDSEMVLEVEIEIVFEEGNTKSFLFRCLAEGNEPIKIGGRLTSTHISIPRDIIIGSGDDIDLTAPIEINARNITLDAQNMILRYPYNTRKEDNILILEGDKIISRLQSIESNGLDLVLLSNSNGPHSYPTVKYVTKSFFPKIDDSSLHEKYIRLKRILMEFRSHSRGGLARFKSKIEHERILKNEFGKIILGKLLRDEILRRQEKFYFLDTDAVNRLLGVSWHDLRRGRTDPKLIKYLRSIQGNE